MIPHGPLPGAEHLGSQRDDAVKELKEARQHAPLVGDDEVEVRRHGAERVDLDAEAPGGDGQRVEDEVGDRGVGAQEEVPAQDATREEIGGTREDGTGLAHGRGVVQEPCLDSV